MWESGLEKYIDRAIKDKAEFSSKTPILDVSQPIIKDPGGHFGKFVKDEIKSHSLHLIQQEVENRVQIQLKEVQKRSNSSNSAVSKLDLEKAMQQNGYLQKLEAISKIEERLKRMESEKSNRQREIDFESSVTKIVKPLISSSFQDKELPKSELSILRLEVGKLKNSMLEGGAFNKVVEKEINHKFEEIRKKYEKDQENISGSVSKLDEYLQGFKDYQGGNEKSTNLDINKLKLILKNEYGLVWWG